MKKYINEKISKLPLHQLLKHVTLINFLWNWIQLRIIQLLCGMESKMILGLKQVKILEKI